MTILNEMPYFFDPRISDMTESGRTMRDVVLEKLDFALEANRNVLSTVAEVRGYIDPKDLFLRAIDEFCAGSMGDAERMSAMSDPAYERKALMSEEFSAVLVNKFYKLLNYGLLLRTIEKAMADMERQGEDDPEKRRVLEEANKKALGFFDALASRLEKDIHYQAIPLKKLISIQLNSGFLTMEYLKEKAR